MKIHTMLLALVIGAAMGFALPSSAAPDLLGLFCPAYIDDSIPETSNGCNFTGDATALQKLSGHDPDDCPGNPVKCLTEFAIDASWDPGCITESRTYFNGSEHGTPKNYGSSASGAYGTVTVQLNCNYNGGAWNTGEVRFNSGDPTAPQGVITFKMQCKDCQS